MIFIRRRECIARGGNPSAFTVHGCSASLSDYGQQYGAEVAPGLQRGLKISKARFLMRRVQILREASLARIAEISRQPLRYMATQSFLSTAPPPPAKKKEIANGVLTDFKHSDGVPAVRFVCGVGKIPVDVHTIFDINFRPVELQAPFDIYLH